MINIFIFTKTLYQYLSQTLRAITFETALQNLRVCFPLCLGNFTNGMMIADFKCRIQLFYAVIDSILSIRH